jgi:hypothetical protein
LRGEYATGFDALRRCPLLMKMPLDVASKQLPVLHIRPNLPQSYRFEV